MLSSDALDIFNSLSLGFLFCFVVVVASPAGFSPWQILDRFVSSPHVPDVFRFNKSRTGLRLHLMVFHRG